MAQQIARPVGNIVSAIQQIEAAFIQLRDEVVTLEEAITPILKPENLNSCGAECGDGPEYSATAHELNMHLDRIRVLRERVSSLISRVDI